MNKEILKPDYLFETSWEVCNKVGGIHTVIASKAITLSNELNHNYICIGPDVWRDMGNNPEFTEDPQLFKSWRVKANEDGLRIRVGRWNIPGNPIAITVDFTTFIGMKDKIFSKYWESYKLDSISGQWDYVEPALFGYAAARVIESYVNFYLTTNDKIVAQFHEWMTGTGVLYIKEFLPQVATAFTTHATVLGRCIAGNNRPLYKNLKQYNPDDLVKEFNIASKQSLEKLAAFHSDCFTTVSELTSKECSHFLEKNIDIITPNGFEDKFLPAQNEFEKKRIESKKLLTTIAEALLGYKLSENPLFICNSGRNEFKNKGIDLYIDALGKINKSENLNKEIIAFVLIPAYHHGAKKELADKINKISDPLIQNKYLTHNLHEPEHDPILNRIYANELTNDSKNKVKVIYVPAYLNKNDGIFNVNYYDVLLGMDISVFPSYYEPWGYTPLESIIFHVPTITTTLAGFGLWVNNQVNDKGNGITVINRTDDNDNDVVENIEKSLIHFASLSEKDIEIARKKAFEISRIAIWENLIQYYYKAYNIALEKVKQRSHLYIGKYPSEQPPQVKKQLINEPQWNRLVIQSNLPEKLKALNELSMNLWWSWNYDAQELYQYIDPKMWEESNHNPFILFEKVDYKRLLQLEKDEEFLEKLNVIFKRFKDYMSVPLDEDSPMIAYFSMEFGLHNSLKIYSGGLGILAGDYLKEASDSRVNIIGIGLLYRYGYFKQFISVSGEQIAQDDLQFFSKLPITPIKDEDGNFKIVEIALPGRSVFARLWKIAIGRINLYLLDTDFDQNSTSDRTITYHLYGGDWENRLKQEVLLGIGGIRAIEKLELKPDVYHCNEGHAAFIGLERLRKYIQDEHLTFTAAKEVVRSSTLFTTHTPVPAGHDEFSEDLIRAYFPHYPGRLKITWDEFMSMGRVEDFNPGDKFNMSHLACNLSQEVNAVSKIHEYVSRGMFQRLWKGYLPEELHVGSVTNGVHFSTWAAKEWQNLYKEEFGENFLDDMINKKLWSKINKVSDEHIWETRQMMRKKLIIAIKERFSDTWIQRHENPELIARVNETLNEEALTIGFARRFATYKRAYLLFENIDRLSKIVNNYKRPVQFIFAGKAHPNDKAGQNLIKMIVDITKRPDFLGKIIFLQNYDMELASKLVQGVDIWLNTPTRPLEASGTSGQKVVMNGGIHFSVLDGWWAEGYKEGNGWALPEESSYDDSRLQDDLDAETIYRILETEIIPLYYKRNDKNIPEGFVKYVKNSISQVAPEFTTRRMIQDYKDRFYSKLYKRIKKIRANNYEMAFNLAGWKKKISHSWDSIEVVSAKMPGQLNEIHQLGNDFSANVVLDLNEISPEFIGVEIVITDLNHKILHKQEFEQVEINHTIVTFSAKIIPTIPGVLQYGIRIFPKHPDLPHRQDFSYVRWI